eukprot:CAMPEP_0113649620 /NCGR_PEP_ID=MMETSP0017_2-20120614/26374_1 /TAXON_ID=2856 /ORGANISM="Cylindrotheca closterium" /LENGTH=786 /DNA_ID=CAMNT_0000562021 /DNA_START=208 /DNA_END=2565 /DNA_ORIENTATION=- /assembly_acc=CAM_ASM_000147
MKLPSLALASLAGSFCFYFTSGHMADPTPFHLYDENGDDLGDFKLLGGDINSWIVDEDGYTVCHKDANGRSGAHHARHLSQEHAEKMRALHQERSQKHHGVTKERVRVDHGEGRGYNAEGELVYYYCKKLHDGSVAADLELPVASTDPTQVAYLEPNIHKSLHVAAKEAGAYGECSLYTGGVCEPDDTKDRLLRGRELSGLKEGTVRNLVIPIRFAGHENRALPSKSDLEVLMNAMQPDANLAPTGGVKKLFHDNSNGKLTLESTVVDWVQLDGNTGGISHTENYCTGAHVAGATAQGDEHLHDCLVEALTKVDTAIDFKQFDSDGNGQIDAITFIHSSYCSATCGGARDLVWSHMWALNGKRWTSQEGIEVNKYHINPGLHACAGNKISTVDTIAHETGHFFGLPDLYDRNQGGNGVGAWSLMASSYGFHASNTYPPMLDPWSKEKLGWGTFTEISSSQNKVVLEPSATSHKYYKISNGFAAGEYLLIENRQKLLWDAKIPEAGLLIWHVDNEKRGKQNDEEGYPGQAGWPGNNKHYMVALMQADGEYKFEKQSSGKGDKGDLYGQCLGGETFGPSTIPNSKGYQGGNIKDTGITITNIYQEGENMVFDVCFGDCASGSVAPATRECCKDLDGYTLWEQTATGYSGGNNCEQIVRNDKCDSTGGGHPNGDQKDIKPKEACCGCKDSRFADSPPPPPPTPPLNPPPATPPGPAPGGSCQDDASWQDKDGDGCAQYQQSWCESAESYKNADGVSATTACCMCKAAAPATNTPPPPPPPPTPPLNPPP